jgi:hypothetical protein
MTATPDPEGHAPVVTVTEVRQGVRAPHLVLLLAISMAVLIVGFIILEIVFAPGLARTGGQTGISAKTLRQVGGFQAPPPEPRESETPQTTMPTAPAPETRR